ncbi:MAG: hypothetical protein J6N72_07925 [Psychrobacter sp.]|nr:hypothetical protein [Psychrobacter sp.]
MKIKDKYEKAKRDFNYLVDHHGTTIYDITGGYLEGEAYQKLLNKPTMTTAYKHFVAMIDYSASYGFCDGGNGGGGVSPDLTDKKTIAIYKYYNLEDELASRWGYFDDDC